MFICSMADSQKRNWLAVSGVVEKRRLEDDAGAHQYCGSGRNIRGIWARLGSDAGCGPKGAGKHRPGVNAEAPKLKLRVNRAAKPTGNESGRTGKRNQ